MWPTRDRRSGQSTMSLYCKAQKNVLSLTQQFLRMHSPALRRTGRVGLLALVILAILGIVLFADWYSAYPEDAERAFVGGARCIECHQNEGSDWTGSHHDLAMDLANDDTVIADFSDQTIEHHGITTKLFRDGERFMVNTEGPDGKMADFHVKYVFGVDPLQQFMVELDPPTDNQVDAVGRVQVLRVSWDTHRKKWFYLNPPDVKEKLAPDDPLHWTGSAQNWNHMCAECHSTDLKKNFEVASLNYHTTFAEIDVSCESCHGPGSMHTELAEAKSLFWDRRHGIGLVKMKGANPDVQIHVCAKCHSRRSLVKTDLVCGSDYYDHYNNELLGPATYYPDGQIRDEVYVMGSFLQSRMYAKGVRCTDCHDPHTAKLKHEGNKVCTSCHQHDAAKYDTPAHHHHEVGSTGASCVECHMMETVYMDVDERRDHSFQIPRPELSVKLKTPNACTKCHLDLENSGENDVQRVAAEKRDALEYYADWLQAARDGDEEVANELARLDAWSAEFVEKWYADVPPPKEPRVDFAEILQRAWDRDPDVVDELVQLASDRRVSGIVRASAVARLSNYPLTRTQSVAMKALTDKDPQVRGAGISVMTGAEPAIQAKALAPLLTDESRYVRVQAALALAGQSLTTVSEEQRDAMDEALDDHRAALKVNADLAGSHMAAALLSESFHDWKSAEDSYRRAIYVMPKVTGPRSNLAALLERLQRVGEANSYRKEELDLMVRDAGLAPDDAWLQYRLGLAFYLQGMLNKAEESLQRSAQLEPNVPDFPLALALLYQKQGRFKQAVVQCESALRLEPGNRGNLQLYQQLRMALDQSTERVPTKEK